MKPFVYKNKGIEFMIPVTKESLVDLAIIMRENINKNGKKQWVLQMLNNYDRLNKYALDVKDKIDYIIPEQFKRDNPENENGELTYVGTPRVLTDKQYNEVLETIPNVW